MRLALAGTLFPAFLLARSSSSSSSSFSSSSSIFSSIRACNYLRCSSQLSPVKHTVEHLSTPPPHPRRRRTMTTAPDANLNPAIAESPPPPRKRKNRNIAPDIVLRHQLDICSKNSDLPKALHLYDEALASGVPISLHHYNVLLYLCTTSPQPLGLRHGFDIFHKMSDDGVAPNEATFTSMARLAVADGNPRLAFEMIDKMSQSGIQPKLRSYGPSLVGFCERGDFEGAHEVEAHMEASGVLPEEPELTALLRVNAEAGMGGDVYRILHRLRALVRQVSEQTMEILERWFCSEAAAEVGTCVWDKEKVRKSMARSGGGGHGQGWLGKGRWNVWRSEVDPNGVCKRCGEKLVSIDIDSSETEDFAKSLSALACQREKGAQFMAFQDWLQQNGPFDAVIDAANVGLNNQQALIFNFYQLNCVVKGLREISSSKKMPLIVLHAKRVRDIMASSSNNKKLLEDWRRLQALYATPPGSNDDWYWLYAAVRNRCLVVTNDEMRDHLFELLGTNFFPRWKEKHQVRVTFSKKGATFHMPPPYSVVIQESERGSWHVPLIVGDDIAAQRQWLCALRDAGEEDSSLPDAQNARSG